jgi:hypothetical protein
MENIVWIIFIIADYHGICIISPNDCLSLKFVSVDLLSLLMEFVRSVP